MCLLRIDLPQKRFQKIKTFDVSLQVEQYVDIYNIHKIDVLINHKLDLIATFKDIYVIDKYNFVDFMQVVVGRD